MTWYPICGLGKPWRCVEFQITYLIFCPRAWKAGKQFQCQGMKILVEKYSERNLSGRYPISFIVCNWFNRVKSYPSKSKCRIPTWKGSVQKDQSPSLNG